MTGSKIPSPQLQDRIRNLAVLHMWTVFTCWIRDLSSCK